MKDSVTVKVKASCTGYELKEMFSVATRWLEKNVAAINALNVFPVPDGDTGTNMLLTMRSTMQEASRLQADHAAEVAQAMARGALMGARGNSGVILSQIMRGVADGLGDAASFGPAEMALAFNKASQMARKAVSKPKEGTILTVIQDVATAASNAVSHNNTDLIGLMVVVVEEARKSVDRTPDLLDVLKQAGVVDSGGEGLYVMLDGMLHYLQGDIEMVAMLEIESPSVMQPALVAAKSQKSSEKVYGYCTEFIIKGSDLNPEFMRRMIEARGESVVVVGDQGVVKVHVHTTNPGTVLEFGTTWGSLHGLKIENMDDQHEEFVLMKRIPVPSTPMAVVAIVAGEGLETVFRSLGATAIVSGGQSMNPSTEEILRAVESVPSEKVIILPNNKNVVLTAQQAAKLCKKKVHVVPTQSVPQGLAAMMAFNADAELEAVLSEMKEALQRVTAIEITRAVRATKIDELSIKKGDIIGLINGKIRTAGDNLWQTVADTVAKASPEKAEIATLYYGSEIRSEEAESLGKALGERFPSLQFEVIQGAQPHYSYIISVE